MRRLLAILLLLAVAMAVEIDPDTGCEKHSDHVLCPRDVEVEGALIRIAQDVSCPIVRNEFSRMEELVCFANATVERDFKYTECMVYVPFDSNDVILEGIDNEVECREGMWRRGDEALLMVFRENFEGCYLEDSDPGIWEHWECPTNGQVYSFDGIISGSAADRTMIAYSLGRQQAPAVDDTVLILIVIAAAVIFFIALSKWGKEK